MTRRFTDEEAAVRILASKARWRDKNREHLRAYDRARRNNPVFKAMKAQWERARRERLRAARVQDSSDLDKNLRPYQTINSTP